MRRLLAACALALAFFSFLSSADARPRRVVPALMPMESPLADRYPHMAVGPGALERPQGRRSFRKVFGGPRSSVHSPIAPSIVGGLVGRAERYLGGNPTGWARRWCGVFMRMIVPSDPGPAFNLARNWARYGSPAAYGCVGCVAVMRGHVGVVKAYDTRGNPIIVSGNHNRRVGVGVYPRGRIIAWRQ